MRVGLGYDVHKLVEGRKLIIGGVNVPHEKGLLGHSDADVLIHAVMDSILGALALGDIGKHFPDTDEKYKGADSMKLLEFVYNLINEKEMILDAINRFGDEKVSVIKKVMPDLIFIHVFFRLSVLAPLCFLIRRCNGGRRYGYLKYLSTNKIL